MDKTLRNVIIFGILLVSMSIAYYFLAFLPIQASREASLRQAEANLKAVAMNAETVLPATDSVPAVAQAQPVAAPSTDKKRVQYTTAEGVINGTYSCYEDQVNRLSVQEVKIKGLVFTMNNCEDKARDKEKECTSDCKSSDDVSGVSDCYDKCFDKYMENACEKEAKAVKNERLNLASMVSQICP